jgi:filamentous hemagglutinin family protein
MNKSYRLIWNELTQSWVAVAEIVKARGKRASGTLLLVTASLVAVQPALTFAAPPNPPSATALPTSGQLVAGQAAINQSQATLTVTQTSHRAAIDWQTFNVGSSAKIDFIQPTSSAAILNRVLDPNPSQIFGRINANGQVFLTNASGIYFSPGSSVNVGALTATTHSISNADFMAGNYRFTRSGAGGKIENEGQLSAELGGYIALLAPEVRNNGVVIAQMGSVVLAAGESYELQFDGNRLASVRVEPATLAALVENGNAVKAPGGLVILSAQAADRLQGGIVKNTGAIEATGLANDGGTVRLLASDRVEHTGAINVDAASAKVGAGGTALLIASLDNPASQAQIGGTISARGGAMGGAGGFVETSAARVQIVDGFQVDTVAPQGKTGQWLLDPVDITIAASGGNVTGTAIANALKTTDVTLDTAGAGSCTGAACGALGGTNGDITINDNITVTGGSVDTTLTLKGAGDIVMNAGKSIDASGNGSRKVSVVFNADSDAVSGGYIWMKASGGTGATIKTNGGNLTLSGGANVATGYAEGDTGTMSNGVLLDSATLHTTGGNIVIRGKSATAGSANYATSDGSINNADGIRLAGSNTVDAGAGTIDIQGVAQGSNSASNGIETNSTGYTKILSSASNTTAINISGDATSGTSTLGWGTFLWGTNTSGIVLGATGTNGGISLNGKGRNVANGGGTHLEPNAFVLATSGPISITGTKGGASTYEDVVINSTVGHVASLPAGFGSTSPVTTSSSNISIASDTLSANRIFGGGSLTGSAVQSSGNLTLLPRTAGNALSVQTTDPGSGSWINPNSMFGATGLFKAGFSKLIFGSGATGTVTLNNYTFDNDTDLLTGGNAVLGAVSIASKTLTVDVTGSGSITDSGTVAVSKLKLNGATSAATLDTPNNAIGTVAANVASLSLLNNSALTIGTVSGTNGISASGLVDIATKSGDLTVSQSIATTNTTANAIKLNAGRDSAAGTSTGGNLIISGSPTVTTGLNGFATFYTGGVAGSTGLTTLIGSGSGRFRYNSDETATNYATALATGKNAIYREQPTITTTANADSKTYNGVAYSGGNGVSYSGLLNGDTSAVLGGALTYGGSSQGAINAGSYTITPGGYTNGLGYALAYANGTLTISPAALTLLTVTASNANKTYGSVYTFSGQEFTSVGLINGQTIGSVSLTSTGAPATAPIGAYPIVASNAAGGTFIPGNYNITYVNGTLTVNKAPLTITANSASKTYDGLTFSGGAGATFSGFVNGETSAVLGGTLSYGGSSEGAKNVGSYAITLGGLSATNYALTYGEGVLTISQAPLTITANNASRIYDGRAFAGGNGVNYSGFVNGETSAVLSGTLGYGGSSQGAKNSGSYAITPSGLSAENYALTYVNGTLSISKAPLIVTANNANRIYDGLASSGGNGVNYSGFVNGENSAVLGGTLSYGGTSQGAKNAGSYPITPSGLSAANYDLAYANGTLIINKAPLIIIANNATKTFDGGAYSGGNGVTYSGFVNGENSAVLGGTLRYGGSSQGAFSVGAYTILPTGITAANYEIQSREGTLKITPVIVPPQISVGTNLPTPATSAPPLQAPGTGNLVDAQCLVGCFAPEATGSTPQPDIPSIGVIPAPSNAVATTTPAITVSQTTETQKAAISSAVPVNASPTKPASTIVRAPPPVRPKTTTANTTTKAATSSVSPSLPDLKSMTPAQVRLIDPKKVTDWTTAMIQGLTAEQVRSLTLAQIAALRPEQIAALAPSQLIALSRDQAYGLSAAQLSSLSKSQLALLNLDRTLLSKEKLAVLDKSLGTVPAQSAANTPPSANVQPYVQLQAAPAFMQSAQPSYSTSASSIVSRAVQAIVVSGGHQFGVISSQNATPSPVDRPFIVYGPIGP